MPAESLSQTPLAGLGLLWLPAALAGLAALARAALPSGRAGRSLALAGAVAALGLALAGPVGPFHVPALLLGARAGLDPEGRLALFVAAGVLLQRGRAPDAGGGGGSSAWGALLAAGLAATAVAFDAATLALGFTAMVLAAYGAAAAGRAGPRGAAAFLALAVVGEVLLVDGLAELGHAAESAGLEAMREAARAEIGEVAVVLVTAAYGLPLGLAGVSGPGAALAALVAAAIVGVFRILPGPDRPREQVVALALVAAFGLLAALAARWGARRAPLLPGLAAGRGGGHAPDRPPAGPRSGRASPRLALAERALLVPATSGVALLVLLVALVLALLRQG